METVQGGVPPYRVKETLVVNGGKMHDQHDKEDVVVVCQCCLT